MSKLYKLKKWYSLSDAAKRLTATLGEPVTKADLIQLMADKELPASWLLQHKPVVEVAKAQSLYFSGTDAFEAIESIGNYSFPPDITRFYGEVSWWRQSTHVVFTDGVFTIDIGEGGADDYFLSLVTSSGGELYSLDGTILVDDNGTSWQLLERFGDEHLRQMKVEKNYLDVANYFPSSQLPNASEVVVRREHLEFFESRLTDNGEKTLGTRERDTLYKIIIGMAVSGYNFDPTAQRSNVVADIVSDLDRAAVTVSDDTVRKYLKEAAQLLPPSPRKL